MKHRRIWVLGAPDPEMALIERVLIEAGEEVVHALTEEGERVHPGNAYRAVSPRHELVSWHGVGTIYAVECAWPHLDGESGDVVTIDHHRPGDPGYGRPPAEFWMASSIGQVWAVLHPGVAPSDEALLAAAADHCLGAAYAGECPGVDPGKLMEWRISIRAAHQGRDAMEILADVEAARSTLRGNGPLVDLRGRHVPELPEAAAREGVAYLATISERDGRVKEVIGGATTPEMVREFMEDARAQGREVYGDPARGFAGAYLTQLSAPAVE